MALFSTEVGSADIDELITHPPAEQYLRGKELFDHHVGSVLQHNLRNSPSPETIANLLNVLWTAQTTTNKTFWQETIDHVATEQWTAKFLLEFMTAYLPSPIRQIGSTIEPTSMEDGRTSVESGAGKAEVHETDLQDRQNAEMTSEPMSIDDRIQQVELRPIKMERSSEESSGKAFQAKYSGYEFDSVEIKLDTSDSAHDHDMKKAIGDFTSTPSIPKAHPIKAELLFLELLVPEICKDRGVTESSGSQEARELARKVWQSQSAHQKHKFGDAVHEIATHCRGPQQGGGTKITRRRESRRKRAVGAYETMKRGEAVSAPFVKAFLGKDAPVDDFVTQALVQSVIIGIRKLKASSPNFICAGRDVDGQWLDCNPDCRGRYSLAERCKHMIRKNQVVEKLNKLLSSVIRWNREFFSHISEHALTLKPRPSTSATRHNNTANMGKGKPRGLLAARKLRNHRREQQWADLHYKKRLLGTAYKSSPFGGSSHAKGIVLEKVGVEAKQPNSAIRKCVRVQLIKNGKKVTAFVPNDGCLNFVDENDEVLLAGFGRKGKAKGDIPGVRFKVVKVSGVGLSALWKEKKEKPRS
ncbi:hypothetical protein BST61_g4033 [Cercospora zeina]